jgi:hypothetical protein
LTDYPIVSATRNAATCWFSKHIIGKAARIYRPFARINALDEK